MTTESSEINNLILTHEKELLNAFTNCDLVSLDALIHENALFVLPNGMTATKKMVLDNYRAGSTSMSSIEATDQKINMIGDTAVVSVNLEMAGQYNEQVIRQQFRYIRVWKMTDNIWKVIAVSGVPLNNS